MSIIALINDPYTMKHFCVITTINSPTKAVEVLYEKFGERLIVVGDQKTPKDWSYQEALYVSCYTNEKFSKDNHYARKNIGYMLAIASGADSIMDIDDDTFPNSNWQPKIKETNASKSFGDGWFNAYEPMTTNHIWPRGFPLSKINQGKYAFGSREDVVSSIQQGLVDGEPDVDAIYRLVLNKKNEFKFDRKIYLQKNSWCPFNSQATWFFPDAYPLMYLPVTSSFRMCDIWRSFVAQKCLWQMDQGVTFHSPSEFIQERNEHNLMDDFKDEIDGYLHNERIASVLESLELGSDVCKNLFTCYNALIAADIVSPKEMPSVIAWIKKYKSVTNG